LQAADVLADRLGIANRLDIFEIEQFVALNLYELGSFQKDGRRTAVLDLLKRYNEIVDTIDTDPSLRIEIHKPKTRSRKK
jgi:hypothetical protein